MMKMIAKFVLVATVASMAIAMSMSPSEAAKKKAKVAASCSSPSWCAKDCTGALCAWYYCNGGAWTKTPGVCAEPFCQPKC